MPTDVARKDKPAKSMGNKGIKAGTRQGVPKVVYFGAFYGRGESIRMLLTHARVDFEDIRITGPEFAQMKQNGSLPSG